MKKHRTLIILLLILVMQLCLRLPFLNEPLEGDEGVYATIGQGVLIDELPYRDTFDHKPPVIYYLNAFVFKFIGQSVLAIRGFTILFVLFGTLGIFWLASLLWGRRFGLVSALFYAIFSSGPLIDGQSANTETFMAVFLSYALLFFVLAGQRDNRIIWCFISGLFSGLAVMTKQVAAVNFIVLGLFLLPYKQWRSFIQWQKGIFLFLGFVCAPGLFLAYFWLRGGAQDFINFALLFNFGYVQNGINLVLLIRTAYLALCENSLIWILALAACAYSLLHDRSRNNLLLLCWGSASLLGIMAGGHYFGHYYLQVLPALCLLSGYAVLMVRFGKQWLNWLGLTVLTFLALIIFLCQYEFFIVYSPAEISVQKYGNPIYVVSRQLGHKLEQLTLPEDKILAIGLPQVHFYSKRRSPGKYFSLVGGGQYDVYLFGRRVYEKDFAYRLSQEMRQLVEADLTAGLKNSKTKFVVFQAADLVVKDRQFRHNLYSKFALVRQLSGQGILVWQRKKL